tara:strand:+ start:324 stop:1004 length:681 start_codon:yes stop_codon:yes gene_type:complete
MITAEKKKIILVEDHELTRIGLKVSLEKYDDIEIIAETANGAESIDLVSKLKPDVVLMDIGLQGMDGIEATRKIKEISPNTRIIMVTSHEGQDEVLASFTSGADGYAVKDSNTKQLHAAIETVSQGDAWLSSQIAEKILRNYCGLSAKDFRKDSKKASPSLMVPLSERELEVLQLIVDGKSNQEIADNLYLSLATAKSHVRSILTKLCVDDRTQAAVKAMREGIVQ